MTPEQRWVSVFDRLSSSTAICACHGMEPYLADLSPTGDSSRDATGITCLIPQPGEVKLVRVIAVTVTVGYSDSFGNPDSFSTIRVTLLE